MNLIGTPQKDPQFFMAASGTSVWRKYPKRAYTSNSGSYSNTLNLAVDAILAGCELYSVGFDCKTVEIHDDGTINWANNLYRDKQSSFSQTSTIYSFVCKIDKDNCDESVSGGSEPSSETNNLSQTGYRGC